MKTSADFNFKLTALGREAMTNVGQRNLSFFDDGIVAGSGIWGECFTGELGHKSSGVINQLVKLGLFTFSPSDEDPTGWYELTELGAEVANILAAEDFAANQPGTSPETSFPSAEELASTGSTVTADDGAKIIDFGTAAQLTVKAGRKWTYIYNVDGELLAEVRSDAAAAVIRALQG